MSSAVSEVDAQLSSSDERSREEPTDTAAGAALVAAITDLHVTFRRNGRDVHALRGVSLGIAPGEILGLIGESGSGKSVLGFTLLGLLAQARVQGSVKIAENDMVTGDVKTLRKVRRLDLGVVFSGPDDVAEPDDADRQAGRRGGRQQRRGAQAAHRGRRPGTQAPVPGVPARAIRWP